MGYRYIDKQKFAPLFPFGYGLSYTTFTMHDAKVADVTPGAVKVNVSVTNTGSRAGAEVVQLYVQDVKSSVARPVKELKAFQKVFLQPGETKEVTLTLGDRAFQFYDVAAKDWRSEPGRFNFLIGNSSKNILQTLAYDLK